jgi:hypothetical protein
MKREYSVVVDNVEVASDRGTFCPTDKDRVAFFSRESRPMQATLPSGWDASKLVGQALFVDHREPVPVKVEANRITIDAQAGRPVIVYRDATIAAQHRGR